MKNEYDMTPIFISKEHIDIIIKKLDNGEEFCVTPETLLGNKFLYKQFSGTDKITDKNGVSRFCDLKKIESAIEKNIGMFDEKPHKFILYNKKKILREFSNKVPDNKIIDMYFNGHTGLIHFIYKNLDELI